MLVVLAPAEKVREPPLSRAQHLSLHYLT